MLKNILANSLDSGIADEEEEEEEEEDVDIDDEGESANVEDDSVEEDKAEDENIKTLIQSTLEYLIQQDKKELLELMREFRKDVGEDDDAFRDTVLEFEELVDVYLLFLEKEPIGTKLMKLQESWKVQLLSSNLSNG